MGGGEGKVVCVTEAHGYVGSWLVKHLLERGYTVRTTVLNLMDPRIFAHLKEFEGAEERLRLFEADLLEDGSLDSTIDGCHGVFHTAPPVISLCTSQMLSTQFIEGLIAAGEKGTVNVLRSCSKARSVRRVVVCSCISGVLLNRFPRFSDPFYLENKYWHALSKTLAEQVAWKFARENDLDLVVLHPGFILGPLLKPTLHPFFEALLDIIKGKLNSSTYPFVDIRDVAHAHIMAFENPSASGRYYLVAETLSHPELIEILHDLYPSIAAPACPAYAPFSIFQVPRKRAVSLGVTFFPVEVTLEDAIESLKEKSLFNL